MNEFLKMDIFFFVTTVAVTLFAGFGVYILWRVTKIVHFIEHIFEQVALESDIVRADLFAVRTRIREGKGKLQSIFSFFGSNKIKKTSKKT